MDEPPASRGFRSRRQEQTPVYNAFAMPLVAGVAAAWGIVLTPAFAVGIWWFCTTTRYPVCGGDGSQFIEKRIRDAATAWWHRSAMTR
jgi:hypothetical protein